MKIAQYRGLTTLSTHGSAARKYHLDVIIVTRNTLMDHRHHRVNWGAGMPRSRTKTWAEPLKWNGRAAMTGYRPRIFCASLADVFDNEVDPQWRADLWELIKATPNLRWMLLTKRIGNAEKMLPKDWPLPHVGLMATMVNQEEWDRDWPKLAKVPAPWRGVSCEPLLGHINIGTARPDWIITGGESGPDHRLIQRDWVRSIRDQCTQVGIAFYHKQWGGLRPKQNGCELDGREHTDFPIALGA